MRRELTEEVERANAVTDEYGHEFIFFWNRFLHWLADVEKNCYEYWRTEHVYLVNYS